MHEETGSKPYHTQSLYESAYLVTLGYKLVAADTTGQKTTLLFDDTPKLRQAVMDFYNGDGVVRAKPFCESYRSLKDMVFQR